MIDALKLYNDIETLKNDISKALENLEGKTPNLHSMRALVACHDLLPYLSALVALRYGNKEEEIIDLTGAELKPGKPAECQGNGEHSGFECCCDECDYYLDCFPI